jgi:hypothetical protein
MSGNGLQGCFLVSSNYAEDLRKLKIFEKHGHAKASPTATQSFRSLHRVMNRRFLLHHSDPIVVSQPILRPSKLGSMFDRDLDCVKGDDVSCNLDLSTNAEAYWTQQFLKKCCFRVLVLSLSRD